LDLSANFESKLLNAICKNSWIINQFIISINFKYKTSNIIYKERFNNKRHRNKNGHTGTTLVNIGQNEIH